MGFLDDLYAEHGRTAEQRVSQELGVRPEQARQALPVVAPIILAGLKREMEKNGAQGVEAKIRDLNQNGIPDDMEAGGLLGGRGAEATQLMANQLGISGDAAKKLIPMLAPVVLGMLLKKGAGAGGTSGAGGMASILDRNGDGSILDDLSRLVTQGGAGGLLQGGGAANKGGCLGTLLGGLMGRK